MLLPSCTKNKSQNAKMCGKWEILHTKQLCFTLTQTTYFCSLFGFSITHTLREGSVAVKVKLENKQHSIDPFQNCVNWLPYYLPIN